MQEALGLNVENWAPVEDGHDADGALVYAADWADDENYAVDYIKLWKHDEHGLWYASVSAADGNDSVEGWFALDTESAKAANIIHSRAVATF